MTLEEQDLHTPHGVKPKDQNIEDGVHVGHHCILDLELHTAAARSEAHQLLCMILSECLGPVIQDDHGASQIGCILNGAQGGEQPLRWASQPGYILVDPHSSF